MNGFQLIFPSAQLAPYIRQYWFLSADRLPDGRQRVIPSGCMGLGFNRREKIYSSADASSFPSCYIFGQTENYIDICFSSLDLILVLFHPVGAKAFFNLPMNELKGLSLGLNMLNNPLIREMGNRIMDAEDNFTCVQVIEAYLIKCFHKEKEYNHRRVASAVDLIMQGETDIVKLAQNACLSYKQFQRIFTEYTGLMPKEYIKINRFSKALHRLQTKPTLSLSGLADECGYYDKSHLIKDIKSLSGYTPAQFMLNADPYSKEKSLFQSVCVDIKY